MLAAHGSSRFRFHCYLAQTYTGLSSRWGSGLSDLVSSSLFHFVLQAVGGVL